VLLGFGALLSGGVQVALVDWATVRQGYFDPEMIGPTVFLFAALSGMTVAAFGAAVAPSRARTAPAIAALAGVVLSLGIVVLNAPGLEGGVAPESVPLMAALLLAAGFSIVVGTLTVRRALM
jgi:sugar phosphate permease